MLSKETESKVVNILKIIANGESSIDVTRKILSDNLEFDPYQIFTNLVQKGNEFITPYDIVDYFNTKKIFISYTEARLLILFYDQNYDGVLSYAEFLPLVQSKNSKTKTSVNSPVRKMNQDIDYYLIKLFQKEVDLVKEIIKLLYDLRIRKDFDCHKIYHAIKNVNKITEDSIGDFFEKNMTSFINDELIDIIKRLDFNKDGIVDLCELHAFFGFPNCTFCCSCTPCPNCGICCCNECLSDIPCYLHKCVHHQCHSPLETKTICNSPLKTFNKKFFPQNNYSSPFNSNNNKTSRYKKSTRIKYDLLNIEQEEEKINKNKYKNKKKFNNDKYINNTLFQTNYFTSPKNSTIELKENYSSYNKKYSSPKKYFISSKSDMGSTLSFSTSPSNGNNYSKNFNTNFNDYSNTYSNNTFMNRNRNTRNYYKGYEEGQFKEYLKALMKVENEIEKGKIELSICNDFTFNAAFSLFDKECKCFINFDDLKEGLYSLGLEPKDDEILLLFNRFDPQKCCNINCENFINVLLPVNRLYRNQMERKMGPGCFIPERCRVLSYDTRLFLKNLMKLIILGEKKMNKLREGNLNIDSSNLRKNFGEIDKYGKGYFFENDLKQYLIRSRIFTDDESSCLLFLKLDKNNDGKVDICEMEDEFKPII